MFELSCIKWQVMTHLVKELKYLCMFLCKYVQDFPEAGVSKKLICFFFLEDEFSAAQVRESYAHHI